MLTSVLMKVLVAASWTAVLVFFVVVAERRIARWADVRWQLLARSTLYALVFTPTAYHHAPNTIIAPLHLSTILGNLFYSYEYTVGMFVYGVAVPLACGWALITTVLLLRRRLPRPV